MKAFLEQAWTMLNCIFPIVMPVVALWLDKNNDLIVICWLVLTCLLSTVGIVILIYYRDAYPGFGCLEWAVQHILVYGMGLYGQKFDWYASLLFLYICTSILRVVCTEMYRKCSGKSMKTANGELSAEQRANHKQIEDYELVLQIDRDANSRV